MAQSRSASGAPTIRSLLTDQRKFLSSYRNEHLKLGSGAFGTVALWTHINSGGCRAIKTQRLSDSRDVKEWEREEGTLCEAERSCDPDARYIVLSMAAASQMLNARVTPRQSGSAFW